MKKAIADENASKEQKLKDLAEQDKQRSDTLKKRHDTRVAELNKKISDYENNLA